MGYKKLIGMIFFLVFLAGCESVLEFPEAPEIDPQPVIEAMITDSFEVQEVRVTYSVSLKDSGAAVEIPNADVCVFSAGTDTFHFTYTGNGWYSSDPFRAEPQETYTLQVRIDTLTIRSTATLIPMKGIESLKVFYLRRTDSRDSVGYVYLNAGSVDPANTKYYQIEASRNGVPVTRGSEIWLMTDQYLSVLENVELPMEVVVDDTVDISLFSLSRQMFDYYYIMTTSVFNLSLANIGYITNPPAMFDCRALGYFQLSAVSSKRLIVR